MAQCLSCKHCTCECEDCTGAEVLIYTCQTPEEYARSEMYRKMYELNNERLRKRLKHLGA